MNRVLIAMDGVVSILSSKFANNERTDKNCKIQNILKEYNNLDHFLTEKCGIALKSNSYDVIMVNDKPKFAIEASVLDKKKFIFSLLTFDIFYKYV